MNTTLYRSTIHPPDTEDRQVLQIPGPAELRELSLADRLTLRIGLWLLRRPRRARRERPTYINTNEERRVSDLDRLSAQSFAQNTYALFRELR